MNHPLMQASGDSHRPAPIRWILAGICVAALIILAMVVYFLGERRHAAAEDFLENLRQAGEPLTMHDLALLHGRFRTATNSAPAFQEIFAKLPTGAAKPKLFGSDTNKWPQPNEPILAPHLKALSGFVSSNAALFQGVEQVDIGAPAVFELDFQAGLSMGLQHLTQFRHLGEMLQAKALVEISMGNQPEAVTATTQLLRLQHALKSEPIMASYSMRRHIFRVGLDTLERLLAQMPLTPEAVRALDQALLLAPDATDLQLALKGERAFGLWAFDHIPNMAPINSSIRYIAALPLWDADRLKFLQELTEVASLATNDYPSLLDGLARLEEQTQRNEREGGRGEGLFKDLGLLHVLRPNFRFVFERRGDTLARTRLARIALAIERDGNMPASLSDLATRLGPEGLKDPFSGSDFQIYEQGKTRILYSLGPPRTPLPPGAKPERGRQILFILGQEPGL